MWLSCLVTSAEKDEEVSNSPKQEEEEYTRDVTQEYYDDYYEADLAEGEMDPQFEAYFRSLSTDPVSPDDPSLQAVFPTFAEEYAKDHSEEDPLLDSIVERSDFAIINSDGEIETTGSGPDQLEESLQSIVEDKDSVDQQSILDDQMDGTTVMLFNIFTPDEVGFLSQLVGEEVVQQLQESRNDEEQRLEETTEKSSTAKPRESLEEYTIAPRPKSEDPVTSFQSKNVHPSSQSPVRPISNTNDYREDIREVVSFEEEGNEEKGPNAPAHYQGPIYTAPSSMHLSNDPSEKHKENDKPANLNRMMEKLSQIEKDIDDKKDDEKGNNITDPRILQKAKLKYLINSLENERRLANLSTHFSTTQATTQTETEGGIPLTKVESLLGEKIRNMNVGVNRVVLDDVLDLDVLHLQTTPRPTYTIGPDAQNKPKRQIHYKLMHQRPDSKIVHRPSINLKARIEPVKDPESPTASSYRDRPLIPRYVGEEKLQYRPASYPSAGYHPTPIPTSSLPPRMVTTPSVSYPIPPPTTHIRTFASPKREKDPYPRTKEFGPYHNPSTSIEHRKYPMYVPTEPTPKYAKPTKNVQPIPSVPLTYVDAATYRKPSGFAGPHAAAFPPMKVPTRKSKSYNHLETHSTKYPPPSSEYSPPNIHFDRGHYSEPDHIHVTPKNAPRAKGDSLLHPEDIKSLPNVNGKFVMQGA